MDKNEIKNRIDAIEILRIAFSSAVRVLLDGLIAEDVIKVELHCHSNVVCPMDNKEILFALSDKNFELHSAGNSFWLNRDDDLGEITFFFPSKYYERVRAYKKKVEKEGHDNEDSIDK